MSAKKILLHCKEGKLCVSWMNEVVWKKINFIEKQNWIKRENCGKTSSGNGMRLEIFYKEYFKLNLVNNFTT